MARHEPDREVGAGAGTDEAARAVVAYLRDDWRQVFHLTTIAQAQAALGLAPDRAVRLRALDLLRDNPDPAPVPRRWGLPTLALTADEKLLGLALAGAGGSTTPAALIAASGLARAIVDDGLTILARLGLIERRGEGWALAEGWSRRLGPLGWLFHEVRPEGAAAFDVPCAIDFLLLVRRVYPDRRVAIRDACARSAAPIALTLEGGAVAAVSPPGAIVFRGGG